MNETFVTYKKRTKLENVVSCIAGLFLVALLTCIIAPNWISKAPKFFQIIMIGFIVISLTVCVGHMLLGASIKTYISEGNLVLTDLSVTVNEKTYLLTDLFSIETTAGDYNGRGTRGGISDGSGNRIIIQAKDKEIIRSKFVVASKAQNDSLTEILKTWRKQGFKIISNGIDLV